MAFLSIDFFKIRWRKTRLPDEEEHALGAVTAGSRSDELLRTILHVDDLDVDGLRAHTKPYFTTYLDLLFHNLESLKQKSPKLFDVLQNLPSANGALSGQGTGLGAAPAINAAVPTQTSTGKEGVAIRQQPEVWFRLLREMVDLLSFEARPNQRGPDLNAIRDRLIKEGIFKANADVSMMAQLILRIFGWLTMLFEPPLMHDEVKENSFSPAVDPLQVSQLGLRKARKSKTHSINVNLYREKPVIDALYHMLRENPFPQPLIAPTNPISGVNLSYYTLSKLAGLRIEWVESLSRHLELNKSTRTLKVFRFPSFCMLLCLAGSENTFMQSIYKSCEDTSSPPDRHPPLTAQDCLQEILYTYTVIFGRDALSRASLSTDLKRSRLLFPSSPPDPLLQRLCTTDWLKETSPDLNFGDLKLVYSPEDDFPFFGRRLSVLQEYTLMQAPNNWTTLWRDRRNPREFYAFWAALIFGVSTIVLAALSVIGMVVQIALGKG